MDEKTSAKQRDARDLMKAVVYCRVSATLCNSVQLCATLCDSVQLCVTLCDSV